MVVGSSQLAQIIIEKITELNKQVGGKEGIKEKGNNSIIPILLLLLSQAMKHKNNS